LLWLFSAGIVIVLFGVGSLLVWRATDGPIRRSDRQVLDHSEKFILYSLLEEPPDPDENKLKFHDYVILGQIQVVAAQDRAELLAALYESAGKGEAAGCFVPRHGIHAVRGNKTVDLLICFQCGHLHIYGEHGVYYTSITHSPLSVFDRTLSAKGVPLNNH